MTRFFPFLVLVCFGLLLTSCQAPSAAAEPEVDATAEEILDVVQDLFQARLVDPLLPSIVKLALVVSYFHFSSK